MVVFFFYVSRDLTFTARVDITFFVSGHGIAARFEDLNRFAHGDAREGNGRNNQVNPKLFLDGVTMKFLDARINIIQPVFFVTASRLREIVDPGELHIHTGELGHMPGGEGGISAENRTDLKDALKSCRHGHLFIKLGGLRQVSLALKIIQREQLRAAFTRGCPSAWENGFQQNCS